MRCKCRSIAVTLSMLCLLGCASPAQRDCRMMFKLITGDPRTECTARQLADLVARHPEWVDGGLAEISEAGGHCDRYERGEIPIHWAMAGWYEGSDMQYRVAMELAKQGADPSAPNPAGLTGFDLACNSDDSYDWGKIVALAKVASRHCKRQHRPGIIIRLGGSEWDGMKKQYFSHVSQRCSVLGLAAWPEYGPTCDAALIVSTKLTPLRKTYTGFWKGSTHVSYLYTGATVTGQVVITVKGKAIVRLPFAGKSDVSRELPSYMERNYDTPNKAPFGNAIEHSRLSEVLEAAIAQMGSRADL